MIDWIGTRPDLDSERIAVTGGSYGGHMTLAISTFYSDRIRCSIDIVGIGPVRGIVRWAQSGKFGVQFTQQFDLGRLAHKNEKRNDVTMLRPWYVDQKSRQAG